MYYKLQMEQLKVAAMGKTCPSSPVLDMGCEQCNVEMKLTWTI